MYIIWLYTVDLYLSNTINTSKGSKHHCQHVSSLVKTYWQALCRCHAIFLPHFSFWNVNPVEIYALIWFAV